MESPVRSGNWKTIGPTNACDKLREPIADDHPEYCSIGNGIDIRPPHSSDDGNIRRNFGSWRTLTGKNCPSKIVVILHIETDENSGSTRHLVTAETEVGPK